MPAPPNPPLAQILATVNAGLSVPSPTEVDIDFRIIAAQWRAAEEAEREALRQAATLDTCRGLWVLSERAAEWALNDRDPAHVDDALDALAIEDFRWDPRDSTIQMALVWHAAEALKADPVARFTAAAERASPRAAEGLLAFTKRSKPLRALKAFEMEVVEEAGRRCFRPLPPPWERPRR